MRALAIIALASALLAAPATFAQEDVSGPSPGVGEVIKLATSGVGEDVLLAYVETSNTPYNLSFEEIIQLNDLGLPSTVIAAMIRRGETLRQEAASAVADELGEAPVVAPAENTAALPPATEAAPAPVYEAAQPAYEPSPQTNYVQPSAPPQTTTVIQREVVYQPASTTVVYAPSGPTSVSYFYDSLSPYGSWVSTPDFGWVWTPTVARINVNWRPYMDGGRWVYTDYGWYWDSSYSWGWAPFHYGRWVYHSHRWCWVPGHTWGPAWVHWREYDGHYGWAPLPPAAHYHSGVGFSYHGKNVSINFHFGLGERDYCFVPHRHFLDHRLHNHSLPRNRVRTIYNNTTIVNNTYVFQNNRIVNRGVGRESVARHTQRQIQTLRVEPETVTAGQRVNTRSTVTNDRIRVFRPEITQAKAEADPPTVIRQRQERIERIRNSRETTTDRRTATTPTSRVVPDTNDHDKTRRFGDKRDEDTVRRTTRESNERTAGRNEDKRDEDTVRRSGREDEERRRAAEDLKRRALEDLKEKESRVKKVPEDNTGRRVTVPPQASDEAQQRVRESNQRLEEARRKAAEDAAKRQEEANKRQAEENERRKKQAEEFRRRQQEQRDDQKERNLRDQSDDAKTRAAERAAEQARQRAAEQSALNRKAEEQRAAQEAANQRAAQEAANQRAAQEAAQRQAAEEAAKRQAEENNRRQAEEDANRRRQQQQNNQQNNQQNEDDGSDRRGKRKRGR